MSGFNLSGSAATGGTFSFGTNSANSQNPGAAPSLGAISLGQASLATGGFSFSASTTTSAPTNVQGSTSFTFGATPTSTSLITPATTTGFGLGAAPATQAAAAPTFSFSNPNANVANPCSLLPVSVTTNATSTVGSSLPFATKTTTSASLNFGTVTTAATSFTGFNTPGKGLGTSGIGGGIFGTKPTSNNLNASLPVSTTLSATSSSPFVGLGGLDVASSQPKSGESKQDNVKVKETLVPEEIAKTIEVLKTHIKNQKSLSSDIGRASVSKLSNVSGEILSFQCSLQEISNTVETNYSQIKLLRKETSRVMQTAEMAQRTQDTPAGLQFENSAPFQLFQNLVLKYETDLMNFRNQIALTEKHMRSLTAPQAVSPDDLKRGFKQINESFVSLAGRLHELHQKVEVHKEQFLNLRKYRLRDSTNVFSKLDSVEPDMNTSKITSGPTPFSNMGGISALGKTMSSMGTSVSGQSRKS